VFVAVRARRIMADPTPAFPVAALLRWRKDAMCALCPAASRLARMDEERYAPHRKGERTRRGTQVRRRRVLPHGSA